jgi:hypothetical protein
MYTFRDSSLIVRVWCAGFPSYAATSVILLYLVVNLEFIVRAPSADLNAIGIFDFCKELFKRLGNVALVCEPNAPSVSCGIICEDEKVFGLVL